MQIAYQYNEETKKYEDAVECQLDPVVSQLEGHDVWLVPANATTIEPLSQKEGFDVVWNGENWEYQEIPQPEPEPEPTPEEIIKIRVAELKTQLKSTDYKIIKCSEASLAGLDLPYDIVALHTERQAIRDEINELENE